MWFSVMVFRQSMREGQGSQLKFNISGVNKLVLRCAGLTSGPRAPAFSRYGTYVRIVVDDPAAP
jgi:hypothetical protein